MCGLTDNISINKVNADFLYRRNWLLETSLGQEAWRHPLLSMDVAIPTANALDIERAREFSLL
jgi:hypothetical protein